MVQSLQEWRFQSTMALDPKLIAWWIASCWFPKPHKRISSSLSSRTARSWLSHVKWLRMMSTRFTLLTKQGWWSSKWVKSSSTNIEWFNLQTNFLRFLHLLIVCWKPHWWQYYLADDTIQVFEPPARNSGCVSGKYIQRISAPRIPGMQRPYDASDCFMDQRMYLFDRIFELMEADEWTLKYMEESPKIFPLANYEWVANKVSLSS